MSETNCKTVGVIGLGNMGFPVSQNLMQAGFSVVGFDPLPEKQDRLRGAGGARRPAHRRSDSVAKRSSRCCPLNLRCRKPSRLSMTPVRREPL